MADLSAWPPERLRALDRAVAEVRGWRWWRSSGTGRRCIYPRGKEPEWMYTPADGTEPFVADLEETCRLYQLPEYSAGCRETFVLQEEARIEVYLRGEEWRARWAHLGPEFVGGPTPAIAICLAYLVWAGKPFEGGA